MLESPIVGKEPPTSKRKGICCPDHPGAKLYVAKVTRVSIGVVLRFRRCGIRGCPYRVTTQETVRPYGGRRFNKSSSC
jgi:hypothetical protein